MALCRSGLSIFELPCADTSQWHIDQISMDSEEYCKRQNDVKKCGAKIARYQQAVVVPTFIGIEKQLKAKDPKHVQFWFLSKQHL